MNQSRKKTAATILWLLLGTSVVLAQDSLSGARDLYASAAYEDALAVLDRIKGSVSPVETRAVDQYRAFCLLALGRRAEAELAIADVVTAEPRYEPNEAEVSPRVRSAFADVRKRMLPAIVQQRYAEAKASFDRKDHPAAAALFKETLALLEDPATDAAKDPSLADLQMLAAGFLELSTAAIPPAPPPPVAPPAPEPAPVILAPQIYSSADGEVSPPTAIRQDMPRFQRGALGFNNNDSRGVLEVLVNESGRVDSAVIRQSVNPVFDKLLLDAAKRWEYQPARRNGTAVKYRKLIQITLERS